MKIKLLEIRNSYLIIRQWFIYIILFTVFISNLLDKPQIWLNNSRCVESSNLPRRPPLELARAHAQELVGLMSRSGLGSCAFASLDELLASPWRPAWARQDQDLLTSLAATTPSYLWAPMWVLLSVCGDTLQSYNILFIDGLCSLLTIKWNLICNFLKKIPYNFFLFIS